MTAMNITPRSAGHPVDYPQIPRLFNPGWAEPVTVEIMQEGLERKPAEQIGHWQMTINRKLSYQPLP